MPRSKGDSERLEALVMEIHRTALEFERFGRYVRGDRDHPQMEEMAKAFERIGNTFSEASNARGALGKARYATIAESFDEIARLIRKSAENER